MWLEATITSSLCGVEKLSNQTQQAIELEIVLLFLKKFFIDLITITECLYPLQCVSHKLPRFKFPFFNKVITKRRIHISN